MTFPAKQQQKKEHHYATNSGRHFFFFSNFDEVQCQSKQNTIVLPISLTNSKPLRLIRVVIQLVDRELFPGVVQQQS